MVESDDLGLTADELDNSEDCLRSGRFTSGCPRSLKAALSCLLTTRRTHLNKRVRNAMGLNSVSKIDRAARVVFPASFLALNIMYWVAYIDLG